MAFTTVTIGATWPAAPQFTAAEDTGMDIPNPNGLSIYFLTTTDDVPPTVPVGTASLIRELEGRSFTLAAGERLWLAAPRATEPFSGLLHH